MSTYQCFFPSCSNEVEYTCPCTSPWIYICEAHLGKHIKLPPVDHKYEFFLYEPHEGTKDAILSFLNKEKSKQVKAKAKLLETLGKGLSSTVKEIKESFESFDSDLLEINNSLNKIMQTQKVSKYEKDPITQTLNLNPEEAIAKLKTLLPLKSEDYENAKWFCTFNKKMDSMIERYINTKLEVYFDTRLHKLEKSVSNLITSTNYNITEYDEKICDMESSIESLKTEVEKTKEDFTFFRDCDAKNLNKLLQNISEDINSKHSSIKANLESLTKFQIETEQKDKIKKEIVEKIKELRIKTSQVRSNSNEDYTEKDFRNTSQLYQNDWKDLIVSNQHLEQAYKGYVNAYRQKTSLVLATKENNRTKLNIYDTETQNANSKLLNISEVLDAGTCIAQIPNGRLFCFGNSAISDISLLIDEELRVQTLSLRIPAKWSSAVYYDQNIYCFGGSNNNYRLNLSEKYESSWIKLASLPKPDFLCNCIVYDKNILVSWKLNSKILRYKIDEDYFTPILFDFAENKRKILVSAAGRAFLIECGYGLAYESEIGDDDTWKPIGSFIDGPSQVLCSYNKGAIFIGTSLENGYYKFNLDERVMSKLL